MIPRNFLNFFKTKSGKLIAFGGLFAMALMIFSAVRKHHAAEDDDAAANPAHTNQSQVVQSVLRLWQPFNPPVSKPEVVPVSAGKSSLSTNTVLAPQNFLLAPIGLFADTTPGISAPKTLSPAFAPFGRLIPCETVITVDSSATQTPIVGLVTDNVYFGGKLIVPAGTEIHGTAQTDHQRERIASGNSWTFVWQNGEEMQIKAIALDREFENATNHTGWSLTDGSAGLRGELIKSDNLADIKLFAATFLSGAASALTEKQQTVFGSVSSPTCYYGSRPNPGFGNRFCDGLHAFYQSREQRVLCQIMQRNIVACINCNHHSGTSSVSANHCDRIFRFPSHLGV